MGDGTDSVERVLPRREFLIRSAAGAGAAGFFLSGCNSGCSRKGDLRPIVIDDAQEAAPVRRPPLPEREPIIRVRLAAIRPDHKAPAVTIGGDDQFLEIRFMESRRMPLHLQAPVRVARVVDKWSISDRAGFTPSADESLPIEFGCIDPDEVIAFDGHNYPGTLRVVMVDNDDGPNGFDVVNHVGLEAYLPGVIARELFSHWHAEAFAAQAVAARSFACVEHHLNRASGHYDVTDTQQSQAYIGRTTLDVALRAAARTRGLVLRYEDALVPAYYSSCCGGIAASAIDAISSNAINDIPPLQSRTGPDACGDSPLYRWQVERDHSDVSRRVRAFATSNRYSALAKLGEVSEIEIADSSEHGRPTRFLLRDDSGREASLAARHFRTALDFDVSGLRRAEPPLRSSFVIPDSGGNRFTLHGRGYGHGVGLCQYGAQALAKRGLQYRAILDMFYPVSDVVGAY